MTVKLRLVEPPEVEDPATELRRWQDRARAAEKRAAAATYALAVHLRTKAGSALWGCIASAILGALLMGLVMEFIR